MALGINNIVGVSGMFIGLVLGGLLAPISWRLVFLISVPVGLFGTVWAYLKLRELSRPVPAPVDWAGNITFALGLILVMVSITYGIRPWNGHPTGWQSPRTLALMGAGLVVARRVRVHRAARMRTRCSRSGCCGSARSRSGRRRRSSRRSARGGLMFMLIIWLQGIWLPLHGYNFTDTPLWAGIYMLPLTLGMLMAGPTSGILSDRFGARWFSTGGMIASAASFALLDALPTDFVYAEFAVVLLPARHLVRHVRLAEPRRGDEQPPAPPPRRRAAG